MAVADSQGTQFVFNSVKFKATKVSYKAGGGSAAGSDQQIDVSTLDLATGANKVYQAPPLAEVSSSSGTGVIATITVDFLGLEKPELNVAHAIDLGAKIAISGTAKATEYTLDASVNDVLRGSVTFDLLTSDAVYVPTP